MSGAPHGSYHGTHLFLSCKNNSQMFNCEKLLHYNYTLFYVCLQLLTSDSWLVFDQSQAQVAYMRYISVGCVVGIIAGFCIGPGKYFSNSLYLELFKKKSTPYILALLPCV